VDTVHECDRRTDRQTDRIIITDTVQRIASHGKKTRDWRGNENQAYLHESKGEERLKGMKD